MNGEFETEKPKRQDAIEAADKLMATLAGLAIHLGIHKDVVGLKLLERGAQLLVEFLAASTEEKAEEEEGDYDA